MPRLQSCRCCWGNKLVITHRSPLAPRARRRDGEGITGRQRNWSGRSYAINIRCFRAPWHQRSPEPSGGCVTREAKIIGGLIIHQIAGHTVGTGESHTESERGDGRMFEGRSSPSDHAARADVFNGYLDRARTPIAEALRNDGTIGAGA